MSIFTSTSRHQENVDSKIRPFAKGKNLVLIISFAAVSCLAFSSAWAGEYASAKTPAVPIHLTSLSIQIGPGGFHLGIGAPFYGRAYGRPHSHVAPRHYWKHSRRSHRGHNHYSAPKRFNRGHGWKNDGPRGNFRGKGGRGNRGHRGGRW